jgi:hypothetical protein
MLKNQLQEEQDLYEGLIPIELMQQSDVDMSD